MPFPSPLFLEGLADAGDGKANGCSCKPGKPNSKAGSRDSSGRLEGFSQGLQADHPPLLGFHRQLHGVVHRAAAEPLQPEKKQGVCTSHSTQGNQKVASKSDIGE